jgi:imidazole glycerol-phosphate synthase subunit HisH
VSQEAGAASVCILDYGSGNTRSVMNILRSLAPSVMVSNSVEDVTNATHLVLPGVGSFSASVRAIQERIPLGLLRSRVFDERVPFLGICVGMQVLSDTGAEFEDTAGLGWVSARADKLECASLPLPHIGWNEVRFEKTCPLGDGLGEAPDFYFVHSFAVVPKEPQVIAARTDYGGTFVSAIQDRNVFGVQFHPEKSQGAGKRLLSNFLGLGRS